MREIVANFFLYKIVRQQTQQKDIPFKFPQIVYIFSSFCQGLLNFNFGMIRILKVTKNFTKFSKQQIKSATYDDLIDNIRRQYNFQQYKNPSSLCLLELHHQFKIFRPGDWVLDVGAGPDFGWTDLALKLTNNKQNTNMVISNDLLEKSVITYPNNKFIRGDITKEVTKTNIGLLLQEHRLNTVLLDISPDYSGIVDRDAFQLAQKVLNVLSFSQLILKPGGTFVFKFLKSKCQKKIEKMLEVIFHQSYNYTPSLIRKNSPVTYYVGRGFLINESYQALTEFIKKYRKASKNEQKMKLIQQYQNKYKWNPKQEVINMNKHQIINMMNKNIKPQIIIQKYENEPFTNVTDIVQKLQKLAAPDDKVSPIQKAKIISSIRDIQISDDIKNQPETFEEFTDKLQNFDMNEFKDMMDELNGIQPKRRKKKKVVQAEKDPIERKPLKDNQVYLKNQPQTTQKIQIKYLPEDLINPAIRQESSQSIKMEQKELEKLQNIFKKVGDRLDIIQQKLKRGQKLQQAGIFDNQQDLEQFQRDFLGFDNGIKQIELEQGEQQRDLLKRDQQQQYDKYNEAEELEEYFKDKQSRGRRTSRKYRQ